MARLVCAFVAGYLFDNCSKPTIMKLNSIFGLCSFAFAIYSVHHESTLCWYIVLSLDATHRSFVRVAEDSLLADLTSTGEFRAQVFLFQLFTTNMGQVVGPIISLIIMTSLGNDEWSIAGLRGAMQAGIACSATCAFVHFVVGMRLGSGHLLAYRQLLADDNATEPNLAIPVQASDDSPRTDLPSKPLKSESVLPHLELASLPLDRSPAFHALSSSPQIQQSMDSSDATSPHNQSPNERIPDDPGGLRAPALSTEPSTRTADLAQNHDHLRSPAALSSRATSDAISSHAKAVRWAVMGYDLLRVLSGGLAVKYFSLFFVSEFAISPKLWCGLALAQRLSSAIFVALTSRCAKATLCAPRLPALVALLLVGCDANNFLLAWAPTLAGAATGFVLREAFLGSTFGLTRAILMDHVAPQDRGKFSALEGLQSGVWSGTAALGGWLVQLHGFRFNLTVMSAGFVLALSMWMRVVCLVPLRRPGETGEN